MIKKLFLIFLVLATLAGCEKDEPLTGNIKLISTDNNIIGASYGVRTESSYFNQPSGSFYAIKNGTISNITEITDLNPGDYMIYIYKTGYDLYKAVQVTAGETRSYNISFN